VLSTWPTTTSSSVRLPSSFSVGNLSATNEPWPVFFREARVASSVDHANIVSIYDYGQTDKDVPYLVMEYVEGTLLYQLVVSSPGKCLHLLQAVDIALQVAKALEHAHQRGVVHRDIKPENILVTSVGGQSDFVKVLDFGVARVIGQPPLTRVGEELIGTPEFLAPEMMSASSDLTPAVDLYALGIMLHDTIVGEPPFRGDLKEILRGHMNVVPQKLSSRRKDTLIPRELDELASRLLEKNPAHRPTAIETAETLSRIRVLLPSRAVKMRIDDSSARSATAVPVDHEKQTEILPHPGTAVDPREPTVGLGASPPSQIQRQAEIDAIDIEITDIFSRLSALLVQAGEKMWLDGWPEKAQMLRELLSNNQLACEKKRQRVQILTEQVQRQQARLQEQKSDLKQQILSLSQRLQLEPNLSEPARQQIKQFIEQKERLLAQVLYSAPTSPEPELYRLRRDLQDLSEQAQVGWPQLARLIVDDRKAAKLPERSTIELLLEKLSAARAMQLLLKRQPVPV